MCVEQQVPSRLSPAPAGRLLVVVRPGPPPYARPGPARRPAPDLQQPPRGGQGPTPKVEQEALSKKKLTVQYKLTVHTSST